MLLNKFFHETQNPSCVVLSVHELDYLGQINKYTFLGFQMFHYQYLMLHFSQYVRILSYPIYIQYVVIHNLVGTRIITELDQGQPTFKSQNYVPPQVNSFSWASYLVMTPVIPLYPYQVILGPLNGAYISNSMFISHVSMSLSSNSHCKILLIESVISFSSVFTFSLL